MSVRTLEYAVSINGIVPANELFAGSQGDIKATKLSFNITALHERLGSENLYYRFDGYDAEGNVLKVEPTELKNSNGGGLPDYVYYTLPESLTRFGGRICVYLVITEITDNKTEMELYSFPARMRLNSLPQGGEVDGEEYESLTTLAKSARGSAVAAEKHAESADNARIKDVDINDENELVITYKDGIIVNLGNVKGDTGAKGDKGETGPSGVYIGVDEPMDKNVNVWINPEGVLTELPSGSGDGKDGFSPTVEIIANDNGHTVNITDANGVKSFNVLNGEAGSQGVKGDKGDKGEKGIDGYTPQKGVDYWTDGDVSALVAEVVDSIVVQHPDSHVIYGDVDGNNNIILNGELDNGTYTLKYENTDGTTITIGTITIGVSEPTIVNLIDTVGYKDNSRWSNSEQAYKDAQDYVTTGAIDVNAGDVIRTKGVNFDGNTYGYASVHFAASDGTNSWLDLKFSTSGDSLATSNKDFEAQKDEDGNVTTTILTNYIQSIRLVGYGSGENLIVTKNQEIPMEIE